MSLGETTIHGAVHGRTIELDGDLGLPDGQSVTLVIKPNAALPADYESIVRQLSGSWSDEGAELDRFLHDCRVGRGGK